MSSGRTSFWLNRAALSAGVLAQYGTLAVFAFFALFSSSLLQKLKVRSYSGISGSDSGVLAGSFAGSFAIGVL
jgi:hypothetical protein